MAPGQKPEERADRLGVGAQIANTYEITRLLGRGGMGTVWEASHARLPGKRVAIKVLHPEVARDQESLARFRREAEIASRIGHPNIVDVHDFNELEDGTPYLVLEFLEGVSLDQRMSAGPMPLSEVLSLIRQIGSGLRAAHAEGVIHRDLKPQNIFLARTTDANGNETSRARILDFGISKIRGSSTVQTQDSTILGTPQYMAPEQATGNHASVDQRTDVFAVGSIVYELLAGRPAFNGQTIPEVVFKVVYEQPEPLEGLTSAPPAIVAAVHKALAKKQEDRFQTIEAFVEALSGTRLSVRAAVPHAVAGGGPGLGLASTIASGNHAAVLGVGETQGSQQQVGIAATIDSGKLSSSSVGLGPDSLRHGSLHPDSMHTNVQPNPGTHQGMGLAVPNTFGGAHTVAHGSGGARGLKVALVLAVLVAVAGAAVAVWAVTRSGGSETQTVAENSESNLASGQVIDAGTVAVAAKLDAAAMAITIDAGLKVADTKSNKSNDTNNKNSKNKKNNGGSKENTGDKPNTGDPDVSDEDRAKARELLAQAKAMVRSDPDGAIRVLRRAAGVGGRGAKFEFVKVMAHCQNRDLSRARSALKRLGRKQQKRAIAICKQRGFEVD